MTTAHRPTWKAAVGKASEGGWSSGGAGSNGLSVLDMPAHTKLKFRKGDQVVDRQKALKESLLKLEKAEKEANKKLLQRPAVDETVEEEGKLKLLKQTAEVDDTAIRKKYDDADASSDDNDDGGDGWSEAENDDLDASSSDDDSDGDSDDDSDDDDDEEAALQAELAKIRAEREEAKRKQEQEEAQKDEAKLEEAALLGNPLLSSDDAGGSGRLKRRWNEDVVFRNQAKGEPEIKKRFINDTVRNDFHKRFLNKFVR